MFLKVSIKHWNAVFTCASFYLIKANDRGGFFFYELICALKGWSCGCSGLLTREACCDLLDMFLLTVGPSKEPCWDNSVIIPGNPGLENIMVEMKRLITASGTCGAAITCPGGVKFCFGFVLEEKTHTRTGKWTLIKYCLCYLLFLRNTSNWWDTQDVNLRTGVKKIMP